MDPGALDKLQQLATETLGELAREVCERGGVQPDEVYEVAVAGNATMTHIALGIDPEPLGMAPFIMATRLFPEVLAADLGLAGVVHPRARAVVFPSFGAYVGGDITAGLLASGMDRDARVRLFIDIGTNCEIVLGNRDWLLATAARSVRPRVRSTASSARGSRSSSCASTRSTSVAWSARFGSVSSRYRFCTAGRKMTCRPTPTVAAFGRVVSGGTSTWVSRVAMVRQASRQPSLISAAV
jgi:hypothetical protein